MDAENVRKIISVAKEAARRRFQRFLEPSRSAWKKVERPEKQNRVPRRALRPLLNRPNLKVKKQQAGRSCFEKKVLKSKIARKKISSSATKKEGNRETQFTLCFSVLVCSPPPTAIHPDSAAPACFQQTEHAFHVIKAVCKDEHHLRAARVLSVHNVLAGSKQSLQATTKKKTGGLRIVTRITVFFKASNFRLKPLESSQNTFTLWGNVFELGS